MIILEWDEEFLATALRVSTFQIPALFQDGRLLQPLVEARILKEWPLTVRVESPFGLLLRNREGKLHKVRSLGKGIAFTTSSHRGAGHSFRSESWLKFMRQVDVFLVVDVQTFPRVKVYEIPSNVVLALQTTSLMHEGRITRSNFLSALAEFTL